jgi:carboxypeptidase C (cathepsin A)
MGQSTSLCNLLLAHAHNFRSEKAGLCLNIYDVRLKDEIPACGMNWPYDLKNVTSYLRVRSLLPGLAYDLSPLQTATRCREGTPCTGKVGGLG